MTMQDDDILAPRRPRSGAHAHADPSGRRPRGPIIDQEGHEIRPESLEQGFQGFRFEFGQKFGQGFGQEFRQGFPNGNPFGNLTREQRVARLEAIAKLLDVAFVLPGTNIRYGIDGLIGLIPVIGDIITTAISLWLVREARALGAPWYITARMLGNVAVDGVVGIVPFAGDAFDVMFRANMRNVRLLRRWLDKQPRM
ncbi:DUF4112 domain-containing protein [Bradyrhizobium guangzhouense]|uniref:DUF4112 domain-containing protein n=1 Tax=Bradyrhizobium guangzhouense TaxID=1325095 RepID=A0AAE5WY13_9BRAD|nr:DUF4112 domain-containing protein [Bradyrhizobium guangzhouense]QAU45171.1 DUF4112 domain-containing protein [Bradyrhizobium guangzhouense]RXH11415.1 DUF4112 domain-containing protein [Bradyrhizobium guangzhouense]RXH12281.1 DUF4112 domain-containing protein [Bradyrhizobium guangzhouense]